MAIKLLLTVATMMVGLVGTAAVASAWHADVTAQADCHGAISYTATAWDHATANPGIEIAYSGHGTAGPWSQVTVGAFNKADSFSFGGTFSPTPNAPGATITIRARASKPWVGQTTVEDSPRYAVALVPARCPVSSPLSVTLPCPNGVVFGRAVTFAAAAKGGVAPYTYQWTFNGSTTGTARSTITLVLTSPADRVAVTVTDSKGSRASAGAVCPGSYPVPTVSVTCPHGFTYGQPATWTATATPAVRGDKLSYRWTVDGAAVGTDSPSVTTTIMSGTNVLAITVTETFRDRKTSVSSATRTCPGTPPVVVPPVVVPPVVQPPVVQPPVVQPPVVQPPVLIPPIQIQNTPVVPLKAVTPEAVPAGAVPATATLPFTGSHVPQQLAVAMGLLIAGFLLLRFSGKPALRGDSHELTGGQPAAVRP